MIAEIHNKISRTGSNLSERLEDKLTGDFFGAIRYLPFEIGLKVVFSSAKFNNESSNKEWKRLLSNLRGYPGNFKFWYRHNEGEIDLLLRLEDALVGIEVKYLSGFSSEDGDFDQTTGPEKSTNQLARYSRILCDIGESVPKFLLFLAPFTMMHSVEKALKDRSIIQQDVNLGFLSWQGVLESLQSIDVTGLGQGQKLLIEDLKALLVKKGFARFTEFTAMLELETYISVEGGYIFHGKTNSHNQFLWASNNIVEGSTYVFNK